MPVHLYIYMWIRAISTYVCIYYIYIYMHVILILYMGGQSIYICIYIYICVYKHVKRESNFKEMSRTIVGLSGWSRVCRSVQEAKDYWAGADTGLEPEFLLPHEGEMF